MRFHKFLLHLYPASFRREYGDELSRIFSQRRKHASGLLSVASLWAGEVFDTLWNASQAHCDILWQDLKFSIRTLARARGFAATAVLVAALGIGANSAVFSIVDQVLIRRLPYAGADRIVRLWEKQPSYGRMELSPLNFTDWAKMNTSFESTGAYSTVSMNLAGAGEPERVDGAWVTAGLFPLLGVQPILGRWIREADDRAGAPGTVVISFGMWQSRFGRSAQAVGQQIRLDDQPYTIIGVLPASFYFPSRDAQFWIPFRFSPADEDFLDRGNQYLKAVAKLKPGVTIEQARAEMETIAARLEREYPEVNARTGATVEWIRDGVSSQSRLLLAVLFAASFCVLLIACTNLGGLFVVRAMGRAKELAVRTALGAGSERLIRQLFTESLVLTILGGALGLILAQSALPLLQRLVPSSLPVGQASAMNAHVFVFAAALVSFTGVGFGVIPAMRICRDADAGGLHEGARSGLGGRRENLRSILVTVEVTLCVILLIASGLLIRALWRIQSVNPGFGARSVLTAQTPLPLPKYDSTDLRASFYSKVLSDIRAQPGVTHAAYISFLPMGMTGGIWPVSPTAGVKPEPATSDRASLRFVTPDFFGALNIPLRLGRDVRDSDTEKTEFVAVVSESFARRFWPGENPVGRIFNMAFRDRTVVGVAGDIRVRGLERESEPQVYLPYRQVPDGWLHFYVPKYVVVRSQASLEPLAKSLRAIVQTADPEIPVSEIRTLEAVVDADTAPRQSQIRVICAFAGLALLLAGIGIHGLLAVAVAQRSAEIGVRMALGARSGDILAMVLRKGFQIAAAGGAAGLVLAYGAGRWMQSLLAGISPADAVTFLFAVALALLTTLSGCFVPALRAVRTDPAAVLRAE